MKKTLFPKQGQDLRKNALYETTEVARRELDRWVSQQPENFYECDPYFRQLVALYTSPERLISLERDLVDFGAALARHGDELARSNNENEHLPRLKRYTAHGTRIEAIDHHPSYHELGRLIYGSGIMEAYADSPNQVGALARFYLSCQLGEAGHNCPLACNAGAIRALQELGTDDLKSRYLARLATRNYDEHLGAAQFLTEIQGGSDVGVNATIATRMTDGTFRIVGEKWFCSHIDADLFLMTARFEGGAEGTQGLGLFLVPRTLDNGDVNAFYLRRLKDKLGTRSMASAEVDFDGALAYHLGNERDGFRNIMRYVINTSRLYNAIGCAGFARRAYVIAHTYAQTRRAFGNAIVHYPLVQETVADLKAEWQMISSGSFHLAAMSDRIERRSSTDEENAFFRFALNLNKSYTAKSARETIVHAIEILGGNGVIETFSVLPRLLRDIVVFENWEGTHNVLLLQIARDALRYRTHDGFCKYLLRIVGETELPWCDELIKRIETWVVSFQRALEDFEKNAGATLAIKALLDEISPLMYAAIRSWELHRLDRSVELELLMTLEQFVERYGIVPSSRSTPRYLARIQAIANIF